MATPAPTSKSSGYTDLRSGSNYGNKQVTMANPNPPPETMGVDCGCEFKETPTPGYEGPGVGSMSKPLNGPGTMPNGQSGQPM